MTGYMGQDRRGPQSLPEENVRDREGGGRKGNLRDSLEDHLACGSKAELR